MRQIPPCYVASNRCYAFQVHDGMPYRVIQITRPNGPNEEIGMFSTKRAAINFANRLAATRISHDSKAGFKRKIKV